MGDSLTKLRLFFCGVASVFVFAATVYAGDTEDLRNDLIRRREIISRQIGEAGMLILFSASPKNKTGDVDYEFRQENNVYYLTGIPQDGTTLVLMPGNKQRKSLLFVNDRDPKREHWEGKIFSKEEVKNISGVQHVYSNTAFESFINSIFNRSPFDVDRYGADPEYEAFFQKLRQGAATVYFVFPGNTLEGEMSEELEFANKLRGRFFGFSVQDAYDFFEHMRQVKSDYEIRMTREAIRITEDAFLETVKAIRPGAWEYEVEAVIEAAYKRENAFDWGFPSIVASGPNATILHYQSSQRQLQKGELILMDLGAEYQYYGADITRTFPVDGKFTAEQRDIYSLVFQAQQEAMNVIKPGILLTEVHKKSVEVLKHGLKKLGLITNTEGDQYKMFFTHGTSHWLGMDVHDVGDRLRTLEPGMIFTVEPGLYIRADVLDNLASSEENEKLKAAIGPVFEKYKNIGVRIEDDVLVTSKGYELLSHRVPRKLEEVEAAFAR